MAEETRFQKIARLEGLSRRIAYIEYTADHLEEESRELAKAATRKRRIAAALVRGRSAGLKEPEA